jgi:hypothetical protein
MITFRSALFLLFSFQSFSQSFQISNQLVLGGNAYDVAVDGIIKNGKKIFIGNSQTGNNQDKTSPNFGDMDFWVVQLNATNTIEWQNSFGGIASDYLVRIIEVDNDNFMIAGSSNSGITGNKTAPNLGGNDFWIIKIDNSGNEIWQKSFGGSGEDYLNDIITLSDGSILMAGASNSPISGDKSEPSNGGMDMWIIKLDQNGNILWDKTIGGSANDGASTIALDESENIYLSGTSSSPISGDKTEASYNGSSDIWVVKLNSSAEVIWDRTIGGDLTELSSALIYRENNLYAIGNSFSGVSGTKTDTSRGSSDYWITKLNELGDILEDKTYGGNQLDQLTDAKVTSTGELILTGTSSSSISGEVLSDSYNSSDDFWTLVVDKDNLNLMSQYRYGGSASEVIPTIIEAENNSLFIFGGSDSPVSEDKTIDSKGLTDFWIIELSTDLSNTSFDFENSILAYPNPASHQVFFSNLKATEKYTVVIYDVMGRTKLTQQIDDQNTEINIEELKSGTYTLQIQYDNEVTYLKLVIQ